MIAMLTIIRMKRHWQFDDKDDVAADDDIDNADDMMTMSLSLLRSSTRIGSTALWSRPPGSSPNTRSGLLPVNYQWLYSIGAVACQPAIINCKWNWWSDNVEVCDPTLFTFLNLATFSPSSWSWPSARVKTRTNRSAEKDPDLIFWSFSKLYFRLKGGALFPYRVSNEVWAWKREGSLCSKPLVQNLSLAPPPFFLFHPLCLLCIWCW